MQRPHTDSHFRLAIVACQDLSGYVEALLGLARDQIVGRRPAISPRLAEVRVLDPRNGAARSRADWR